MHDRQNSIREQKEKVTGKPLFFETVQEKVGGCRGLEVEELLKIDSILYTKTA